MVTIETTNDLLRLLDEDPAFHEAVRSKILTDELMRLPVEYRADVGVLKEDMVQVKSDIGALKEDMVQVKSDVGALKEDMVQVKSDIGELKSDVGELKSDVGELKSDVGELKSDVGELKSDVGVLKEDMVQVRSDVGEIKGSVAALDTYTQNLHSDYDRFRGSYAENAARKESGVIAGKITRARGTRVRSTSRYGAEQLTEVFEQAIDRDLLGDIDDESQDRFTNADDVLLVTERNRERSNFFIVTEASHTMKFTDVHRACNHAKVIERVTGIRAFAVVAGVRRGSDFPLERVTDSPDELVLRDDADTALVHEVEKEHQDPMTSPR